MAKKAKKVVNKVKTDHTIYDKVAIRQALVKLHRDYEFQDLGWNEDLYESNKNYQRNFRVLCNDFFPLFFNFCANEHEMNPILSCERAAEVLNEVEEEILYYNEDERPKIQDLTTDEILFASGFFMSMFLIEYCNWSKKRVDYLFDNLSKFNK
jgi:hypothetical protein